MTPLQLLPAVDVSGGRHRGDGDPLQAALRWQREGASWVHLVDLDAAYGRGDNWPLLAGVVDRLDIAVELAGGINDDDSLRAALATGCRRVVLGTAALERPAWCAAVVAEHGERIAVGLDVRDRNLAARGRTTDGGDVYETLAMPELERSARYVVTDVTRDGTLAGPNINLLRSVCAATGRPVIASGGVSSLADLRTLAGLTPMGVEAAIVGSALYAGLFTLPEALDTVAEVPA